MENGKSNGKEHCQSAVGATALSTAGETLGTDLIECPLCVGRGQLKSVAEAAFLADSQAYAFLRPVLLKLKAEESRSASSSTVLDHDVDEEKSHDPSGPAHSLPAMRLVAPQRRALVLHLRI